MNPFTNRGMVTDPADFIGRREQMEEICTRLDNMESTSIVGERCIGKSSLLYQLALAGKECLGDPAYRFFYIDLQDAHCHTALGFFQTVLGRLGAATDAVKEGNSTATSSPSATGSGMWGGTGSTSCCAWMSSKSPQVLRLISGRFL